MNVTEALLAYLLAASLLTVTPGVDTALVLRTAAIGGTRAAWYAAIGVCLGCLAWGGVVSVGLGAVLAASELAFTLLKWMGAAYLLYLGVGLLVRPRRTLEAADPSHAERSAWDALRRGFLTNVLNPKVGVFYVTFLPQFVPAGVNVAGFSFLLAALHAATGLLWFGVLIAATLPMARALARPRVLTALDRLTGAVFVGFGIRLAIAQR